MLFKPMKGSSERISTSVTPFHEGWAYFTVDDGKFYIDAVDEDGTEKRTCINPDDTVFVKTFAVADWSGGRITISASEHKLSLKHGSVGGTVYALVDGAYTSGVFAAMDTEVSAAADKSIVLSYDGAGYAGKVVLYG